MSIYVLSKLRSFNVRRGFLEIFFLPEFQKTISDKSVMVILSTRDITVSNPPERECRYLLYRGVYFIDSDFIAESI